MYVLEFKKDDLKIMQYRTAIPSSFLIIESEKDSHCFQCSQSCTSISSISFVEKKSGTFICERCIFNRIKWLQSNGRLSSS